MAKKKGIEGIISTVQSIQESFFRAFERGTISKGAKDFAKRQVSILRKELANQLAGEISAFIKNLNLAELIKDVISDVEVEIKISLSFNRKKKRK